MHSAIAEPRVNEIPRLAETIEDPAKGRVPVGGGEPVRLDWAGSSVFEPTLSATGRFAFTSDASTVVDIWRFDLSAPGAPARPHPLSSTMTDVDPDFSPDGSRVLFSQRLGEILKTELRLQAGAEYYREDDVYRFTLGLEGRRY